jgi:hypothetical protein
MLTCVRAMNQCSILYHKKVAAIEMTWGDLDIELICRNISVAAESGQIETLQTVTSLGLSRFDK